MAVKEKNDFEKAAQENFSAPNQPPIPCPICRSPFFWLDVYGGGPHCLDCRRPPSKSLVRRPLWGIAGSSGGYWWETLEDPPRVFCHKSCGNATNAVAGDAGTVADEPQVVVWEFPGPGGRLIYSVAGRSRVDRGTLHWAASAARSERAWQHCD